MDQKIFSQGKTFLDLDLENGSCNAMQSFLISFLLRETTLLVPDGSRDSRRVWLRAGDTLRCSRRAKAQCYLVRLLLITITPSVASSPPPHKRIQSMSCPLPTSHRFFLSGALSSPPSPTLFCLPSVKETSLPHQL